MEKEELKELFKKYHAGQCTEEEKALLEAWYLQFNEYDPDISPRRIKAAGRKIFRELPGNQHAFIVIGLKLAAAAIGIGFLVTIIPLLSSKFEKPTSAAPQEILPGINSATLTLSNGKKIDLDKVHNGQLALQSGIQVVKTTDGQLAYKITDTGGAAVASTNNLTTPRGGQWQVILPDGSHVWLNSASSIVYPVTFKHQKQRVIKLSGEAYFEVEKDKQHPFIVLTKEQRVTVLGTHFNINSYADEPTVKTTLEEGRIKISDNKGETKYLRPGQQAVLTDNNLSVTEVSIEEALAWKNGYFRFNDENIPSIMRKLSRWYNIEVIYEKNIPTGRLNGKISRYKNISQVLTALEAAQTVHFKTEGRRITVMK